MWRIEANILNGAEISDERLKRFEEVTEALESEGYEWTHYDKIGSKYDMGEISMATMILDESLAYGEQKVIRVHTPQILKDGKMVQAGEYAVAFNDNIEKKSEPKKGKPKKVEEKPDTKPKESGKAAESETPVVETETETKPEAKSKAEKVDKDTSQIVKKAAKDGSG